MKIAIRADASTAIGSGHIRRCISLAKALTAQGAEIRFCCRQLDFSVDEMLSAHGFRWAPIATKNVGQIIDDVCHPHAHWLPVPVRQDALDSIVALADFRPELIVVDHYALDGEWHEVVRGTLACGIAVIEDLADRPLAPDLLVDHNPARDHSLKYRSVLGRSKPVTLYGPRFALIDAIYACSAKFEVEAKVASVGVFMGGVDAADHSSFALATVRAALGPDVRVEIATTGMNPHLARLGEAAAADPNLTVSIDQPNLAGFFARHDLQVGGGGGALWERCCLGAPTIALICADNQLLSVPVLERAGVVLGLDARAKNEEQALTLQALIQALASSQEQRSALSERSKAMVDGHGCERVAQAIAGLIERARK